MRKLITMYLGMHCCALALLMVPAHADTFCFAQAQGYYEQIYCEVKASGKGHGLPSFYEFQRNAPLTQALLLKRPAAAAGVELVMPTGQRVTGRPQPRSLPASVSPGQLHGAVQPQPTCWFKSGLIHCGDIQYKRVGNLNNTQLEPGALGPGNLMNLRRFDGDLLDEQRVQRYLLNNYRRYIDEMVGVGLGGVTMTYGKFEFLFRDLYARNVDFIDRFERMFMYLKKDKRNLSAIEPSPDMDDLTMEHCAPLSERIFICVYQGRNHVFSRLKR